MFCQRTTKKPTHNFYKDYGSPEKVSRRKLAIYGGIALLAIAIGVSLTLAYFYSPAAHTFMNHTFSQIQNGQLSVGQGLLYVALPTACLAVAIGAIIYVARRYNKKSKLTVFGETALDKFRETLINIVADLKPTKKQLKIGAVVLGIIALIAVGTCLVLHYVPSANQALEQAFNHKIMIWQSLAYMGGGVTALAVATAIALYIKHRRDEQQKLQMAISYDDDFLQGTG